MSARYTGAVIDTDTGVDVFRDGVTDLSMTEAVRWARDQLRRHHDSGVGRQERQRAHDMLDQWQGGPLVLCGFLTRYEIIPQGGRASSARHVWEAEVERRRRERADRERAEQQRRIADVIRAANAAGITEVRDPDDYAARVYDRFGVNGIAELRRSIAALAADDPAPTEPVGLADIALRLGVEPQTARNWRTRGVLPPPEWTVSGSPAWSWSTIEAWARETGRLP